MEIPNDMVIAILLSVILMVASLILGWGVQGLVLALLVFCIITFREQILKYLQDFNKQRIKDDKTQKHD